MYLYIIYIYIHTCSPKCIKQHKIIISMKSTKEWGWRWEVWAVDLHNTNKITLTPVLSNNYVPAIDDSSITTNRKLKISTWLEQVFNSGRTQPHYPWASSSVELSWALLPPVERDQWEESWGEWGMMTSHRGNRTQGVKVTAGERKERKRHRLLTWKMAQRRRRRARV